MSNEHRFLPVVTHVALGRVLSYAMSGFITNILFSAAASNDVMAFRQGLSIT